MTLTQHSSKDTQVGEVGNQGEERRRGQRHMANGEEGLCKNTQPHYHSKRPEEGLGVLPPGPKVTLKTEIEAVKR